MACMGKKGKATTILTINVYTLFRNHAYQEGMVSTKDENKEGCGGERKGKMRDKPP
jgi:hypothetical protein